MTYEESNCKHIIIEGTMSIKQDITTTLTPKNYADAHICQFISSAYRCLMVEHGDKLRRFNTETIYECVELLVLLGIWHEEQHIPLAELPEATNARLVSELLVDTGVLEVATKNNEPCYKLRWCGGFTSQDLTLVAQSVYNNQNIPQ